MNIRARDTFDTLDGAGTAAPGTALGRAWADSRIRWGAIAAAGIAIAAGLWLLLSPKPVEKKKPLAPVIVATAQRQDVRVVEHTIATVLAENTVQLGAQVTGQLTRANFHEGQIVHRGDLLFEIDARPFQAALAQAQAQLAKDQASLSSAQNDERRYTTLFNQGAASQQQRDQAVAAAKGFLATVQSDKAAIDMARLNVGYTRIRSPITGKTGAIMIQPGNLIAANAATPLVTITQVQPVKVSFFLPQNELGQIQAQMSAGGLQAVIPMPGAAGDHEIAPVNFVGNAVSAQTGTIELRATFTNEDFRLVPGQTVDVGVTLRDIKGAVVVPRDAVNAGQDKSFVYVVDAASKAHMRSVEVLNDDGTDMAIRGKIKPGDKVVVEGQLRVTDGAKVAIDKHGHHTPRPRTPVGAQ
ncbi:MAG TPA: efflux RND transporter periplasmic adaptor subunit [Rhizomicrobium sp.]|nr:efflux RND transporter periplasmic adaptor subunit [Rhizomicrobium sp.]